MKIFKRSKLASLFFYMTPVFRIDFILLRGIGLASWWKGKNAFFSFFLVGRSCAAKVTGNFSIQRVDWRDVDVVGYLLAMCECAAARRFAHFALPSEGEHGDSWGIGLETRGREAVKSAVKRRRLRRDSLTASLSLPVYVFPHALVSFQWGWTKTGWSQGKATWLVRWSIVRGGPGLSSMWRQRPRCRGRVCLWDSSLWTKHSSPNSTMAVVPHGSIARK